MKRDYFKKILLSLLLVEGCSFVVSCSDDDTNDAVMLDMNTVETFDSLSVDFRLLNAEGQAVKTFKEGEQILFYLNVTNKTDKTLKAQSPIYIVGDDLFQIYSNGKPSHKPWDYSLRASSSGARHWFSHASYVYQCPWQGPAYDAETLLHTDVEMPSSGVALLKSHERQSLPVGNYYTEFKLNISENNIITCHKDFSVIAQ